VQHLERGHHIGRVLLRARDVGVHGVVDELRLHGLATLALIAIRDDAREIDEGHLPIARRAPGPAAIGFPGRTFDTSVFPEIALREREENRRRALRARVGDHVSQVVTEGVHGLVFAGDDIVDLRVLVADPRNGAACAQRPARTGRFLVERAGIVVAELDDHEVAGLHVRQHLFPMSFRDEGAAAAAAARGVDHPQLRGIEERLQYRAPALLVLVAVRVGGRGGIAGDEKCRRRPGRGGSGKRLQQK
jgi:hypothetical protein